LAGDVQTEIASAAGLDEPGRRGPGALRSLRHRDFALFWSGLIVSSTGSWMQNLAQGWLVYDLTHSKAYLGIVSAAGTLPVLLLTLPSGVIADRFSKRRIVILTQALLTLQAFVLATLVYLKLIQPWQIVVLASFSGMVNALDVPARQAMTVELVGKEDLLNAVALNSSAFNGARIVGPAIAGIIVAAGGPAACFFCNGASYLAVIVSLLIIRTRPFRTGDGTESILAQIREGLAYARRNPLIRDLLILTGIPSVFALQYAAVHFALFSPAIKRGGTC
jgi:MFS family permease